MDNVLGVVPDELNEPGAGADGHAARPGHDDEANRPHPLRVLIDEYHRALNTNDRQYELIIRVASIGFTATAAGASFVAGRLSDLPELTFWVLPSLVVLLYAMIIQFVYRNIIFSYHIRDLEQRIQEESKLERLRIEAVTTRALTSLRTGFPPFLATYLLILIFGIAFYVTVVYLCYFGMQQPQRAIPRQREITFLVLYCTLAAILLWIVVHSTVGSRHLYEKWIDRPEIEESEASYRRLLLRYAVIPRVFDLVLKSAITASSFVVTVIITGTHLSSDLVVSAVLVVVCIEFLAKQATYVWNDVLDLEADRTHPHKRTRPLVRLGPKGLRVGKLFAVLRAGAALGLALVLWLARGLWWVPILVVLVFLWQYLYDRWGKRGDVRRLWIAAIGYLERAAAGALTVMTVSGEYDVRLLVLICAWTLAFGLVLLASYWRAEHLYLSRDLSWFCRPDQGPRVQHIANSLLFPLDLLVVYYYSSDASRSTAALLLGSIAGVGMMFGLTTALSHTPRQDIQKFWGKSKYLVKLRMPPVPDVVSQGKSTPASAKSRWLILGALAVASVCVWFLVPSVSRWVLLALVVPLGITVLYERLSYEEIAMIDVGKLLAAVVGGVNQLLFGPTERQTAAAVWIFPASPVAPGADDWVRALARMYTNWALRHGYEVEGLEEVETVGEEHRPSFLLMIRAPKDVYGQLKDEPATHRLCLSRSAEGAAGVTESAERQAAHVRVLLLRRRRRLGEPREKQGPDPVNEVEREYECRLVQEEEGYVCDVITDRRYGQPLQALLRDEARGVMAGRIDGLLDANRPASKVTPSRRSIDPPAD
jgi:4-hydroxybenzoate polyprenyltransferase